MSSGKDREEMSGRLGTLFWQTNASIPGGSSTESLPFNSPSSTLLLPTNSSDLTPPRKLLLVVIPHCSPTPQPPSDKDKLRCIFRAQRALSQPLSFPLLNSSLLSSLLLTTAFASFLFHSLSLRAAVTAIPQLPLLLLRLQTGISGCTTSSREISLVFLLTLVLSPYYLNHPTPFLTLSYALSLYMKLSTFSFYLCFLKSHLYF